MEFRLIMVGASGAASSRFMVKYGADLLGYYASGEESVGTDSSVMILSQKAPLQLDMIPDKMLTATALFEIKTPLKEEQIRELNRRPDVVRQIAALRERPGPSLKDVHLKNMPAEVIGKDCRHWTPSLGKTGFYSISERSVGRFDTQHYLAVYAPVDLLVSELTSLARRKAFKPTAEHYTIGQFADSRQYRMAKELAMRNSTFLGKEIASILGIEIELVGDRVALAQLDLSTGQATHQVTAKPVGISLFGHLLPVEYSGTTPTPVYPAVAVYSNCCHPGSGQDTPVVPLNPVDGMAWISGFKASYASSPKLNPATISMTLPCGSGHENGTRPLDRSTTRYVDFCLGSLIGEKVTPTHPKVTRNYRSKDKILENLEKAYPQGNPVVLQHLFSTV
jgi:hypothetical protein